MFKKIDASSNSACHSNLSIFSTPPTQVSIVKSQFREILPLSENDPYEFRITPDSHWTDLSHTFLYLKLSLEKLKNGVYTPIEKDDLVAPCQQIGLSFVRQLRVSLNNVELYDSTNLYSYLAYIKNELSHTNAYKDSIMASTGYYSDSDTQDSANNSGHKKRCELAEDGKTFELMSPVEFDLANQPNFLINNVDLVFTFYKQSDSFLLNCYKTNDTNIYRIKIHSIKMYVKTLHLQPSIDLAVLRTLQKESAKYAMRKLEIRPAFLTQGKFESTVNVFSNVIPRKLIIALVSADAFNGNYKKSPFVFKPFDLSEITVNAGGLNYPSVPLTTNYTDNRDSTLIRQFIELHDNCNLGNNTNGITLSKFKNGWNFHIINISDDCEEGFSLIRNGTTSVRLQFRSAIPAPGVVAIFIGEFDQLLQINNERVISSDNVV